MAKSNSQRRGSSPLRRIVYLADLLKAQMERRSNPPTFDSIANDTDDYLQFLAERRGTSEGTVRTLEIGVGQRPYRLMTMQSRGYDAFGVDLDRPVVRPRLADFVKVARENGLTRAAKTAVRTLLFDAPDYAAFRAMLSRRFGVALRYDEARVHVGDAGRRETWNASGGRFDIIHSDDVFEHIPPSDLEAVVALMAANLASDGVAIVTPMVFTGICGGHQLEWYPAEVEQDVQRAFPAWGHLTGETPAADTYLNRLTRSDYRDLFARHFTIVHETAKMGSDFGRRHLTAERKSRLQAFSEDELFSNTVRFYLVPKRGANDGLPRAADSGIESSS